MPIIIALDCLLAHFLRCYYFIVIVLSCGNCGTAALLDDTARLGCRSNFLITRIRLCRNIYSIILCACHFLPGNLNAIGSIPSRHCFLHTWRIFAKPAVIGCRTIFLRSIHGNVCTDSDLHELCIYEFLIGNHYTLVRFVCFDCAFSCLFTVITI